MATGPLVEVARFNSIGTAVNIDFNAETNGRVLYPSLTSSNCEVIISMLYNLLTARTPAPARVTVFAQSMRFINIVFFQKMGVDMGAGANRLYTPSAKRWWWAGVIHPKHLTNLPPDKGVSGKNPPPPLPPPEARSAGVESRLGQNPVESIAEYAIHRHRFPVTWRFRLGSLVKHDTLLP